MKASVIVPTYQRPDCLLQALKSLQAQTLSCFEIIVVDNAVDSKIRLMTVECSKKSVTPIKYIPEPRLGLHNARHTGALASSGKLLVFTDDDATFDPKLMEAYIGAFQANPNMVAAGGPVRAIWESPPPQWLLDYMGDGKCFPILSLMEPYGGFRLDKKGYFFGVNMAIRRHVLLKLGGFNPEIFGNTWLGDGESGLNRKIWHEGMLVGYVPGAVVYHHIPHSRMRKRYFYLRMANEGAGTEYARFHDGGIPGSVGLSLRYIRIFLELFIRSVVMTFLRMIQKKKWFPIFSIRMELSYNMARLRYVRRLFRDIKLRQLVVKKDWLK